MKNSNQNLIIIPARGGSKRLPGKNLRLLGHLTLVEHSIKYALDNRELFTRLIVTTDDQKINEVALKNGAEVIHRPPELSSDSSTTVSAMKHVLETLNAEFDYLVLLQPTNPLRPKDLLKEAFKKVQGQNYDSLMTVSPIVKKIGKLEENKFVPLNYKPGQRSQDLEPLFYENGLLYLSKPKVILSGNIIGDNNYSLVVDHPFAEVDIDTQEDLEYADYLSKKMRAT